ncbi:MAG TPA: beta-ketoacyl-ACP synthase III [Steroidobacteraceae bacterium]|nr:beta-ketoacyl-ACP synthase III [Steroidobacteraceae bacterium]
MYSRIIGTGSYLPERVLTNFDLEKRMDTSDAWIRERTGIVSRRIAAEGESNTDMAEHAARAAIAAAGLTPEDIDLIAVGTTTPDLVFPNAGTLLQARLGCRGAPAFSLEAACSGFLYALAIADKFVRAREARYALVVGSEILSRITDYTDRSTAILFGDGAGAVVLTPSEEPGILSTHLHADGSYQHLLYCTGGPARGPAPGPAPRADQPQNDFVRMQGGEVFKIAVTVLGRIVDETLAANQLDRSAIDWLVPHQANFRIIQAVAKKLGMPIERVIVTIQEHGNTSTASVPLALDIGIRDGRIKRGDMLLLEALGGGLTWGSALLRY